VLIGVAIGVFVIGTGGRAQDISIYVPADRVFPGLTGFAVADFNGDMKPDVVEAWNRGDVPVPLDVRLPRAGRRLASTRALET
jgi:hypothetical protein